MKNQQIKTIQRTILEHSRVKHYEIIISNDERSAKFTGNLDGFSFVCRTLLDRYRDFSELLIYVAQRNFSKEFNNNVVRFKGPLSEKTLIVRRDSDFTQVRFAGKLNDSLPTETSNTVNVDWHYMMSEDYRMAVYMLMEQYGQILRSSNYQTYRLLDREVVSEIEEQELQRIEAKCCAEFLIL